RKASAQGIAEHYLHLLGLVMANVDIPIEAVEIVPEQEKKQLLYEFNDTTTGYPAAKTIHRLFEEQVERTPERIAAKYPIDLSDIYEHLKTGAEKLAPTDKITGKITNSRFTKNPYLHHTQLELPGGKGKLIHVKTNRHNSVIIDNNMAHLLERFNGTTNLKNLYDSLERQGKIKGKKHEYLIYTMSGTDLLEVTHKFNDKPVIFTLDTMEDMVKAVRVLYNQHLIRLTGVETRQTAIAGDNEPTGTKHDDETAALSENIGENSFEENGLCLNEILQKHKKTAKAQVLLLGDTPGIASTGILYLGAYLARNGVSARCRYYDDSSDYETMKRNIEALLREIQPGIVAVSMKWFLYIARVLDTCEIIREYAEKNHRQIKIVVGGNTASYYREEIAA
ncbi:MAG: hypothetical protein GY757_14800, partial [bacterium]|nr:hypothetical protein [bacterium]